jgi:transglutaminase/protease-like cytokinesis protein 3
MRILLSLLLCLLITFQIKADKADDVVKFAKSKLGCGYVWSGYGQKLTETDHEYNLVKIDGNWYAIDATWGAGHIVGKSYVKEFNEFYFLTNPELLIKSHFPEEEKWQLTKKRYTLADFERWPLVYDNFYKYGFTKFLPEEGVLELKDSNIQKF